MDWHLVPGRTLDFHRWSYGKVASRSDLYDPRIFGHTEPMACVCGKYSGESAEEGMICESCGVRVTAQVELLRRTRLGHVELLPFTRHPLGGERTLIDAFPIAPIACRVEPDGTPNALGRKYEALLGAVEALRAKLPDRGSAEYYRALVEMDRAPLQAALADITGRSEDGGESRLAEPGTLFAELFSSMMRLDRSVSALIRALGCTLRISGTI